MEEKVIIGWWEFDDCENLIVQPVQTEMVDFLDRWVKETSPLNILSRPVTIKSPEGESAEEAAGYILSVYEFRTNALGECLRKGEGRLTAQRIKGASRMQGTKTVKTVYIRKSADAECTVTENKSEKETKDQLIEILTEKKENNRSIMLYSTKITSEGYCAKVLEADVTLLYEIIEAIFPYEYNAISGVNDTDNGLMTFLFSREEFDVYALSDLRFKSNFVTVADIVNARLSTPVRPVTEWGFKGIRVPEDYVLMIDGKEVECEVVEAKKKFQLLRDIKVGNYVAFDTNVVGRVAQISGNSLILHGFVSERDKFYRGYENFIEEYITKYNGHVANDEEMKRFNEAMMKEGLVLDEKTGEITEKFPWLKKTKTFFYPHFSGEFYRFELVRDEFDPSVESYVRILRMNTPIFETEAECKRIVDIYNSAIVDAETR